jgi:hypothetical protein
MYIQYMNTLTRIAVTVKFPMVLPTPSTQAIGTLPTITLVRTNTKFIEYGTWGGKPNQPIAKAGLTLMVDGVAVATGAGRTTIKKYVEAWANSHGIENVSVMIR